MKFLFLLLSFCASFYLKAQKEITNWYDAERKQKKEVFFEKKVGDTFIREGQYIIYHKNGVTFQKGSYLNGELDGVWIIYYENGSIKENLVFKNNLLDSEGILIVEHSEKTAFSGADRFTRIKNYGSVNFSFFE